MSVWVGLAEKRTGMAEQDERYVTGDFGGWFSLLQPMKLIPNAPLVWRVTQPRTTNRPRILRGTGSPRLHSPVLPLTGHLDASFWLP